MSVIRKVMIFPPSDHTSYPRHVNIRASKDKPYYRTVLLVSFDVGNGVLSAR